MDGDIYCGDMFFLVWISKHKRKELHAAHDSFLFMGVFQTPMENLFMYPILILLLVHIDFSFIDCLTQYFHTLYHFYAVHFSTREQVFYFAPWSTLGQIV